MMLYLDTETKLRQSTSLYFKLLWLWTALSSVVFIEPAPYDIMFPVLLFIALISSFLTFSRELIIPLLSVGLYINCSVLSLIFVRYDLIEATKFLLITLYLATSWLFFVGILQRYGQAAISNFLSGYIVAAIISTSVGILAFLGLIPNAERFLMYGEVAGLFKDPNVFGPFLIPGVLYAITRFENKAGLKQFLWLGVIFLLSMGVLLSFSRAAWGNYLISIGAFFLLPPWEKFKGTKLIKLVVISVLVTIAIFGLSQIDAITDLLTQKFGYQDYDNDRFGTQWLSLKLALENPLGIGPFQTEQILDYSTHSLYVRVMTENGIIGLVAFSVFILSTLFRSIGNSFKSLPYSNFVTATLIGIMFNSLFIDTLHWRYLWFIFALPWFSLKRGEKNENSSVGNQVG